MNKKNHKVVLRASRKAALADTSKSRKKVERFIIADPPASEKRKAEIDDNLPIGRLRRPRVKWNKI